MPLFVRCFTIFMTLCMLAVAGSMYVRWSELSLEQKRVGQVLIMCGVVAILAARTFLFKRHPDSKTPPS